MDIKALLVFNPLKPTYLLSGQVLDICLSVCITQKKMLPKKGKKDTKTVGLSLIH
jgi:hypothetical protein